MDDVQLELDLSSTAVSDGTYDCLCRSLGCESSEPSPDEVGDSLRAWSERVGARPVNTLSLFTGAGGLDIGFHDAGFNIMEMVEFDERYSRTLARNVMPDGFFQQGIVQTLDVRDYLSEHAKRDLPHFDLIIGGPPCQSFSAAGRRAAGVPGTTEQRGVLFEEYVRLLKLLRPKAFVFENVYGITGAENGESWKKIQSAFESAGYRLHRRILDAADFGVPQHRERLILVGVAGADYKFPRPTHGPDSLDEHPFFTPSKALRGLRDQGDEPTLTVSGRYSNLLREIPPGLNYSYFTEKMGHPRPIFAWRSKFSDFLYKADPHLPVRTIKAFCGKYTGPFHWDARRFSIRELKRLQTFPDAYVIEGSRGIVVQQIGNSVPPQMARMIAISVLDQVFGVTLPTKLSYLDALEQLGFRRRKRNLTQHYREKAHAAISRIQRAAPMVKSNEEAVRAVVNEDFSFDLEHPDATHSVTMSFLERETLQVFVTKDRRRRRHAFEVEIRPAAGISWVIPAERVLLCGTELDDMQFLLTWKMFGHWLRKHRLRDDLVQLAGYYAYEPDIVCKMRTFAESDWKWSAVSNVVAGIGVRSAMSRREMANVLQLEPDQTLTLASRLRELGYEVRSANTNPQMEPDSFLIPYCFPTLTERSVQRNKDVL